MPTPIEVTLQPLDTIQTYTEQVFHHAHICYFPKLLKLTPIIHFIKVQILLYITVQLL